MDDITSEINQLKEFFNSLKEHEKNISGKYFNRKKMIHFPNLYFMWEKSTNKNEFVYDILFGIKDKPKCCVCGKETHLRSFKKGYNKTCSVKCRNEYIRRNPDFSKKISETMKNKFNSDYFLRKYEFVIKKNGENFLISNYCKHGDFWINKNRFIRLMENGGEICEKCADENSVVSENTDVNVDKYVNEDSFKRIHPNYWKTIVENCLEKDASFSEKKYMYKIGIRERPLCPICGVRSKKFVNSYVGYTQTCTHADCVKTSSSPEYEIFNVVSEKFSDAISRYKIDGEEIDIFIPNLKIGIEFNGLYWHSEKFRSRDWHLKKIRKLRNMGLKVFTVWEDDWKKKREIVMSQMINLFGMCRKIHARKTEIRSISVNDAQNFLEKNHLQGSCVSSVRYGLFFEGRLVSVMTFGKRKIFRQDSYELLRFCNKLNISVVGGASKLLKYFIDKNNPDVIVSYANYDISDGNLYRKLGFDEVDKIYPGYWWCKDGEKYNRNNFMKHKIANTPNEKMMTEKQIMENKGYYRVWNSGNIKFEWKRKNLNNF